MTRSLDVLVIESHRGAGAAAVHALAAAGHHVHRCEHEDGVGSPCRGVPDPVQCPLAHHIDVALLVGHRSAPHRTALEPGAACAIDAGVPLVEAGPPTADPLEPWLAGRTGNDAVTACEGTGSAALGELRREILRRVGPILSSAGVTTGRTLCRLEPEPTRLLVRFDLPFVVAPAVRQALAVRVLDAVRGARRTYGPVQVSVNGPD